MLKFLFVYFFKRYKTQTTVRSWIKNNYTNNKICLYTSQSIYKVRYNQIKRKSSILGFSRSFCSGNVKLKSNTFIPRDDLTSNLQAESSAEAASRITRIPNPNRIAGLVKRIYTIFIENDLDTKINNMNDLLLESF